MIRKLKNTYLSEQKGTTAVEFALVSLVFLTIVFAIMESGRLFWALNAIEYAVDSGARYVLVNADASDDEVENVVRNALNGIPSSDDNPVITIQNITRNNIDFIVVTANYTFQSIMPFLPAGWRNLPLAAQSRLPLPEE